MVGKEYLSLGRHRDDCKQLSDPSGSSSLNPGNFIALLQFRAHSGDTVLAEHLRTAFTHHNTLYTSKTTQNEFIDTCGSIVRETILAQIGEARFSPLR